MDAIRKALTAVGMGEVEFRTLRMSTRGDVIAFDGPGGEEAIELWRSLRAAVGRTGYWPVMLGGGDDAMWDEDNGEDESAAFESALRAAHTVPVEQTLAAAASVDGAGWFARMHAQRMEHLKAHGIAVQGGEEDAGKWPEEAEPHEGFSTPYDVLTDEPHESVLFGLVPTREPWEVPAFLGLGGWNDCPEAAEHCAVLKYWHGRYGAEIVAATRDVIEMNVARPPQDRESALALAREQYTYCGEIVDQGCETIANLAAALLRGSAWYSWWD